MLWRLQHRIMGDFCPRAGGGGHGKEWEGAFGQRLPLPDDFQIGERMLAVGGKRGDRFACV